MESTKTELYADVNVKAYCQRLPEVESLLLQHGAAFKGEDLQTDTFYETSVGKLKLREGSIENLVTHYVREEIEGEWRTRVFLYEKFPTDARKRELLGALRVIGRVQKKRKIFFIDNVKFHLDQFEGQKNFIEVEAIDLHGNLGLEKIRQQAEHYKKLLQIHDQDILTNSYIDMF
jgi:adenylate cyclase, class 2